MNSTQLYNLITTAAALHAENSSNPEHEAGDLQDVLGEVLGLLTDEQRATLLSRLPELLTDFEEANALTP